MAKKQPQKLPNDLLGCIEELVLAAAQKLGTEASGMTVYEEIQTVYPPVSFGSVYTALERMTWKGYLESRLGDPEPRRGGRARKYYRITKVGKAVLETTVQVHERVSAMLIKSPA